MRTVLRRAALGAMLVAAIAPAARGQTAAPSPAPAAQAAASDSPTGLWRSIDDQTKQPRALIRIAEQGGVLTGRVERILTDRPDAVCEACTDDRRGKPIQGMTILSGLKREGDEWTGGEILDPASGKTYRARLRLAEGGRKLDVRGFVGVAAFGRSQTWIREN